MISDDADWLTVNPTSGSADGTATVTASENTSTSSRSATVTISGTGVSSKTVTVTQEGADPYLTISKSSLTVGASANSSGSFTISSNTSWTISDDRSWLSVSPSSGSNNRTITVSASENTSLNSRSATVTISASGVSSKTVSVTQEGADPYLSVNKSSLTVGASANSTGSFTISSNINWSISEDTYWLTVNTISGSGDKTITVTVTTDNISSSSRSATVTISGTGVSSKSVSVTQQNDPNKDMVYLAAGSFEMGGDAFWSWTEVPIHTVNLSAFRIDKYEVTNAKYSVYLNEALAASEIEANASSVTKDGKLLMALDASYCQISYSSGVFTVDSGKDNYPVIAVTWYGSKAYAEHYGKRLPTEAEWEYAARGGNQSQGYLYSGSNNVGAVAWYMDNSGGSTHAVASKQANELGIYDMSGNVWEDCNDWYGDDYYSYSPSNNPQGPSTGTYRVARGGTFHEYDHYARCGKRKTGSLNNNYSDDRGFRCVR